MSLEDQQPQTMSVSPAEEKVEEEKQADAADIPLAAESVSTFTDNISFIRDANISSDVYLKEFTI